MPEQFWANLRVMIIRHRIGIQDASFLLCVALLAAYLGWSFDVFQNESQATLYQEQIELDEALGLGGLLGIGLLTFGWRRMREQKREMQRRITAEREARTLALHDPLTGLPNRRQFDAALRAATLSPPRAGGTHAVLLLDLNGFKKVNDVHGHPAGDEVLVQIAGRFSKLLREGDIVARLGGDEFALLAHHLAGPEEATNIALSVIAALRDPVMVANIPHAVGTGIGIALIPQDAATPVDAVRKADIALYRAKTDSVSCLRFFEAEMDAHVRERDALERELRAAIGTPALRVHYQPLVELKTERIMGFEALARWQHPTLGEVLPERFIPIAENSGLISLLTDSLLEQACTDATDWPDDVTLSFNISPVQLKDVTLGLRIFAILGRTGLAPTRLELEITESALVRDMETAQATVGVLRQSGIRIALDDFGTGYSSLYHLRNFKLDKIKIDRSFVARMTHDRESNAIVKALVGLGAGLSLTVTAEGVENSEQEDLLRSHGCEQAQGFLFSEAISAEETRRLLSQEPRTRAAGAAGSARKA